MKYLKVIVFFVCVSSLLNVNAQEIPFGSFSSQYAITPLATGETLNFPTIIQDEGSVSLTINEATQIAIEGTEYLDITVDVEINDDFIYLNGVDTCTDISCRIPFNLKSAYYNRSNVPSTSQAVIMNGAPLSARFPIRHRGNAPPGPPPTPVYSGYDLSLYNETAYIFLYGDLTVGSHNAGSYSNTVTITVTYE